LFPVGLQPHREMDAAESRERYEWLVPHKNHITGTSNGTDTL